MSPTAPEPHLEPQSEPEAIPKNMSTSALERRLRQLKDESQRLDQVLTQKLASTRSGQNLLHIGTSLGSLPPDLHLLLQQLHPVLSQAEAAEADQRRRLDRLLQAVRDIRLAERRVRHAQECADLLVDLEAAERAVALAPPSVDRPETAATEDEDDQGRAIGNEGQDMAALELGDADESEDTMAQLEYASSLERAAHVALCLIEELHTATDTVSAFTAGKRTTATDPAKDAVAVTNGGADRAAGPPSLTVSSALPQDSERAQFVMKLAPRVRKLEADTVRRLSLEMERLLQRFQAVRQASDNGDSGRDSGAMDSADRSNSQPTWGQQGREDALLLMLGHVMRGLVLLGRGKEVESIFARVAIMPLVRPQISMGRMDEGGSRGECAGLPSLLEEMMVNIASSFGPVIRLSEAMFDCDDSGKALDVDLITAGVWVPIATALMADAGIKMAIFSPGIASILQVNYRTLDSFLSKLAERLLVDDAVAGVEDSNGGPHQPVHLRSNFPAGRRRKAQERIYSHPKTSEFSKRWNLPIYYQLRFGECCTRLNKAIDTTRTDGWIADVFTGSSARAAMIKNETGFEISLFMELYDILFGLWAPDVIIAPLTNRFLRGAIQLLGRVASFVQEGMLGQIKFGHDPRPPLEASDGTGNGQVGESNGAFPAPYPTRAPYCWGDNEVDIAAVAWELTILESVVRHDYGTAICDALEQCPGGPEQTETRDIVKELLSEAAGEMGPLIDTAWNDLIVKLLTRKCSQPLAAVKGVAATYRMTNRPPPTQASPFVATILRPLKEFTTEFQNRTPERIGSKWKHEIVVTIADQYATAVEELINTVQRTEVALNSRRSRRTSTGGMRDGEKVKLQVYLDYLMFKQSVKEVGVDPATVIGLSKLMDLTAEGEELQKSSENGND